MIVGGPGAWQLQDEETRRKFGIDCVVVGEGERVVSNLFEKALNSEELPASSSAKQPPRTRYL